MSNWFESLRDFRVCMYKVKCLHVLPARLFNLHICSYWDERNITSRWLCIVYNTKYTNFFQESNSCGLKCSELSYSDPSTKASVVFTTVCQCNIFTNFHWSLILLMTHALHKHSQTGYVNQYKSQLRLVRAEYHEKKNIVLSRVGN